MTQEHDTTLAPAVKTIYVASPLGFSELSRPGYEKLLAAIRSAGKIPVDPWSLIKPERVRQAEELPPGPERRRFWELLNIDIARANAKAIRDSSGLVAVLDGADIDSGVAAEIGYAASLKKVVLGYRNDVRRAGDNEGATVNLQVEYFVVMNGGCIVHDLRELKEQLWRVG